MDWLPSPEPPWWALNAGLPEPRKHEKFCTYVQRLGLDCAELTQGLGPRTALIANLRLATAIARDMPEHFSAHVKALFLATHHVETLEDIKKLARRLRL